MLPVAAAAEPGLARRSDEAAASLPARSDLMPPAPAGVGRLLAAARLVHPFPSILDGLVVGVVAMVAGARPGPAAVMGVSVCLLQFAIGALNDLVDRPRDALAHRVKPLVDGIVGERMAQAVVVLAIVAGLGLGFAAGGPLLLLVAVVGLAIGLWYDLAVKGTPLSWLPMALGIPLLPVYGWLGATGTLAPAFAILVPAAMLAGGGLAIANAAVDLERDELSGTSSVVAVLGLRASAVLVLALQIVVGALALASTGDARGPWHGAAVAAALVPVAGAGLGLLRSGHGPAVREVAFEVQAVGLALLAVAWVNAWSLGPP